MDTYHTSVLLKEAINFLKVQPGEKYIDATLGGGGHSLEILKRGGKVLGIDLDQDALDFVEKRLGEKDIRILRENREKKSPNIVVSKYPCITIARGNFKDIKQIAETNGFGRVAGILMDLGVSSYQFDTAERGFSFQSNAPLDMRMDKNLRVTAADLINILTRAELIELFTKLGEEVHAKSIATTIEQARSAKRIETTKDLADVIARKYQRNTKRIHPATKIFQALRIAVNDELNNLREALPQSIELLQPGGRLVIISFHSLEDRIVKTKFAEFEKQKKGFSVSKKPIEADYEEITQNRRSRSAKMRVFEKN